MKINGLGQIQSKSVKKSRKSSGGSGASFSSEIASEEAGQSSVSSGVSANAAIGNINALLSLQEAPTSTDGRSRGLARAEAMLESLDELRKGILLGTIPSGKLKALASSAREGRAGVNDPALEEILAEIELRAEVELAKLNM